MLNKPARYKNKDYIEYIKEQPCCITERPNVDPHHTKSIGSGGSDLSAIPLTHELHVECHKIGRDTFQKKYNIDFKDIIFKLMERFIEQGKV